MSADSGDKVKNLGVIDVSKRNSWGAQIDSFSDYIDLNKEEILSDKFYATFIRGPRFSKVQKIVRSLDIIKTSLFLLEMINI